MFYLACTAVQNQTVASRCDFASNVRFWLPNLTACTANPVGMHMVRFASPARQQRDEIHCSIIAIARRAFRSFIVCNAWRHQAMTSRHENAACVRLWHCGVRSIALRKSWRVVFVGLILMLTLISAGIVTDKVSRRRT